MPPTITVAGVNHAGYMASYNVAGLDTAKTYDVVRVLESANANERKYSAVAHRRNWRPGSAAGVIRDYEAPLRPYRVGLWDSSLQTPLDWLFEYGPYAGPGPVAQTAAIDINPPGCGALLRSTATPGLWAEVKIQATTIDYPARIEWHKVIASRFPVAIADRREGRTIENLVLWAPSLTDSKTLTDLLIPETGRVHPLWLRTSDADELMFHDLMFMPGDITVEPISYAQPFSKWFQIATVEVDPRTGIAARVGDGDLATPPTAVIGLMPSSQGKKPFTVTFTDESVGTYTSRRWVIYDDKDTYATSTAATYLRTFKKAGTFTVKLTVSGSSGSDVTKTTVRVTK